MKVLTHESVLHLNGLLALCGCALFVSVPWWTSVAECPQQQPPPHHGGGVSITSLSSLVAILLAVVGATLLRAAVWAERVGARGVHELVQMTAMAVVAVMLWTMLSVPIGVVTVHLMLCAALVLWSGACVATVLFHRHEHQL